MIQYTSEAMRKANAIKPIEFYKPVKDEDGRDSLKYYVTDQANVYLQKDLDNCDYLEDIKKVKIQKHDNDRTYTSVDLRYGEYVNQPLPRVVLRTFDPSTEYTQEFLRSHQANHINPVRPLDNSIYNLEWVTHEENMYKAGETGAMLKKYDKELVHTICQMICNGKSRREIHNELGVDNHLIDDIHSGRSHKSVSSQYLDKGFEYLVNDRPEKRKRAEKICQLINEGYRDCEIVKMLDLPNSCVVGDIKHKRAYTYISDKYF